MACEVKGQGHIEVMNVHDTSHGDIPICQIWYAYVKDRRHADRQTMIPIHPLKLYCGGYNNDAVIKSLNHEK